MSDLRRTNQAKRDTRADIPSPLQRAITYTREIFLGLLAIAGYARVLVKFISPVVTYAGLPFLLLLYFAFRAFLKRKPQAWVFGSRSEQLSSVPRIVNVYFMVVGLSLFIPRVIDWLSPAPQIEMTFARAPGEYAEGFEIDGIKWRNTFVDYRFAFRNNDDSKELTDVRIDFQFRAGVVKSTIVGAKGVDTVTTAPFGLSTAKGNARLQRVSPTGSYYMNLLITAIRVFPNAEFTARIILLDFLAGKTVIGKTSDKNGNDLCISFYYDDFWGNRTKNTTCYALLQKKDSTEIVSIDLQHQIPPEERKLKYGNVFHDPQNVKGLNVILSPQ